MKKQLKAAAVAAVMALPSLPACAGNQVILANACSQPYAMLAFYTTPDDGKTWLLTPKTGLIPRGEIVLLKGEDGKTLNHTPSQPFYLMGIAGPGKGKKVYKEIEWAGDDKKVKSKNNYTFKFRQIPLFNIDGMSTLVIHCNNT